MKQLKFCAMISIIAIVIIGGCVNRPAIPEKPQSVSATQAKITRNDTDIGIAQTSSSPENVPLVRLLADPEKMNEKRVTTVGVLAVEVEGTALYLNRESYYLKIRQNAVAIMPTAAAASTLSNFAGQYVTVTGTFEGIPSLSRWPGGMLKDISPIAVSDMETPSFSTAYVTIQLTSSESDLLDAALKKFADDEHFRYRHNIYNWHGRLGQNYILQKGRILIGVTNDAGPNTFRISISALDPWVNWEVVRIKLTQYLKSKFSNQLNVHWIVGHSVLHSGG